jgi:hypothetical protein
LYRGQLNGDSFIGGTVQDSTNGTTGWTTVTQSDPGSSLSDNPNDDHSIDTLLFVVTPARPFVRVVLSVTGGDADGFASAVIGRADLSRRYYEPTIPPNNYVASQNGTAIGPISRHADTGFPRGIFRCPANEGRVWSESTGLPNPLRYATITGITFSHGSLAPANMSSVLLMD